MRILMTNHRLTWYSGSDTYLYTLGKELINRGHTITIYSPNISLALQGRRFLDTGFEVIDTLEKDIRKVEGRNDFDVVHGQHNNVLSDVCDIFTELPAIFVSHGVLPELEKYPRDVAISKYIGVSEEVANYQFKNIENSQKEVIRNPIDTKRFYYSFKKPKKRLKILIASNYFHNDWEAKEIWEAVNLLNADLEVIGTNGKMAFATEELIKNCDIGIGVGRSILEVMAMGKPAIVGDYAGYDGAITPKNYSEIRKRNFSSRTFKEQWDGKRLAKEIKKIFSGDYKQTGKNNRDIILKHHNVKTIADRFEVIYKEISKKV